MVSIVGKKIQVGMSFNSNDSDDGDSEPGSDNSHDDIGSAELIFQNYTSSWEIKKINTVWVGVLLIFVTLSLLYVTAIIVTVECRGGPSTTNFSRDENHTYHNLKYGMLCYVPPVSLIMYLQSLLWGLFLICDQYLQYEHIKSRRRGYLKFYNKTRTLSQMPFFVVTAWCALLLTISTVLHDNCATDDRCGQTVHLGKAEYALFFVGLEGIFIILFTSIYIYKVYKFNKIQALPDVLNEEYMSMATDFNPNSFGQVDEEIFQRQADVIRHISEHNVILRRKVMELNNLITDNSHTHSV